MESIVPLVNIGPGNGRFPGLAMSFMSGTMAEALSVRLMVLAAALWAVIATHLLARNSKSGIICRNYIVLLIYAQLFKFKFGVIGVDFTR